MESTEYSHKLEERQCVDIEVMPGDWTRYHFVVFKREKPGILGIAAIDSVRFRGYEYHIESVKEAMRKVYDSSARLEPKSVKEPFFGYMTDKAHSDCDIWTALAACDAMIAAWDHFETRRE